MLVAQVGARLCEQANKDQNLMVVTEVARMLMQ
jgi:hypothetical protein